MRPFCCWLQLPMDGDNVTIPYGWNLVIDIDTANLNLLLIEGVHPIFLLTIACLEHSCAG